jgi:DNA-binding MarR family transcriptional regulator
MSSVDFKTCAVLMEKVEQLSARYVEAMATAELTGVQGLMLMRLSDGEERIGNLGNIYFGTNISYNVKKLTEMKYIKTKRGDNDQRMIFVRLTDKGKAVRADLEKRHEALAEHLDDGKAKEMYGVLRVLRSALDGDRYPGGQVIGGDAFS